jgi:hypothetical protein
VDRGGKVLPFKLTISNIWDKGVIGKRRITVSAKLTAGRISKIVASVIQITP